MKNIKVGIIGWNGKKNVGDDAMAHVIVERFKDKYGANTEFVFLANGKDLPHFNAKFKGFTAFEIINKIPGLRTVLNLLLFVPSLVKSNYLVIGGGSIFHTISNTNFYTKVLAKFKKRGGNKAVAIGVSIGPFPDEESAQYNYKFLRKLNFLGVRDKASNDIILKHQLNTNYAQAIDLAILFPTYIKVKKVLNDKITVGLSLRSGHHSDADLSKLAQSINTLFENSSVQHLKIFQFCAYEKANDIVEINKLISRLKNVDYSIILYSKNTVDFYNEIAGLDHMIATRLHAAIIAYSVGVKSTVLSYHIKCEEFGKMAGMPNDFILNVGDYSCDDLIISVQKSLNEAKGEFYSTPIKDAEADAKGHFNFL